MGPVAGWHVECFALEPPMKKTTKRKLSLSTSTIRSLTLPEVARAQGGMQIVLKPTISATWGEPGCFPCYPDPTGPMTLTVG